MNELSLTHRLLETGLVIILTPFRRLPEKYLVIVGLTFGWILRHIIQFRRNIVVNQIKVAFDGNVNADELRTLLNRVYRHLGLLTVELLALPRLKRSRLTSRFVFHGEEHVTAALAGKKGLLVLTGHVGNWEYAGAAWSHKGYRVFAIGKEMKFGVGNVMIKLMRHDNGVETVARRKSIKKILKLLRQNEIVVVLLDQNMTKNQGVFVDFFAQKASTMPALAVLAARSGAPVLPYYSYRDENLLDHHCVVMPPVKLPVRSKYDSEAIIADTQRFTDILEAIVRRHPDQWLWIHKRWRSRPRDEEQSPFKY